MRRPVFRTPHEHALQLFARAPSFELASTRPDGGPVLRTLHGVVEGGALCFHGSPVGEKMDLVGREAVVGVHEVIASLPSYFLDADRACPATTLYVGAQAHGVVAAVTDPNRKARVLDALMHKLQPEGGHAPIDPADARYAALYAKVVAKLAVMEIPLGRMDGKAKLLQHKSASDRARVIERLWQRGGAGDARAIERILEVSDPSERPAFLRGPSGTALSTVLEPGDAAAAATLLEGTYWNDDVTPAEIAEAHEGSTAWVGARDEQGALVASARAVSDGAKHAWIYDVVVRPDQRGRGIGGAVVRLLLDHPGVRRARQVHLGTRDGMTFYAPMGFVTKATIARPYRSTEMVLVRGTT